MRSIAEQKEHRRQRLAALMDEVGQTKLAELTGIPAAYLFQMAKGTGAQKRGVNDEKARLFERCAGKPQGWLDADATDAKSALAGSLSEPARQGSESGPSFFEDLPRSYYTAPEDIRAAVDKLLDTSAKNTKHREALARMIHAYYETQET